MKSILIVILAMIMIVPAAIAQGQDNPIITYDKIDNLLYNFHYAGDNITEYRWVFGDGTGSTMPDPAHQYLIPQNYTVTCDVLFADNSTASNTIILDARVPISTDGGMLNVGEMSIPGAFLMVSCGVMFMFAQSGAHPLCDYVGKKGIALMMLGYFTGAVIGFVIVVKSIYPGVL